MAEYKAIRQLGGVGPGRNASSERGIQTILKHGNLSVTEGNVMRAYIDIKGVAVDRHELTDSELQEIGEFTRENVLRWLKAWLREDCNGFFWGALNYFEDDDFHAVCGDTDIPWANEDTKRQW